MAKSKGILGVFSLAMINIAIICSLRGLPMMAEYGPSIIFFLLVAVLVFLIPVSKQGRHFPHPFSALYSHDWLQCQ